MGPDANPPRVNRFLADAALAGREAKAIGRFARRDPKMWSGLVVTAVSCAALAILAYWLRRGHPYWGTLVTIWCVATVLGTYVWLEWSTQRRLRRLIRSQSKPGALLTTEFASDSVKISTPDMSYEIPYASLTHVVQFGDVLVLKPDNHLVRALPMELVPPQDYALIRSMVTNRPMREASIG